MDRLAAMIEEAEGRREHLLAHRADLEAGREPAAHEHAAAGQPGAARPTPLSTTPQ